MIALETYLARHEANEFRYTVQKRSFQQYFSRVSGSPSRSPSTPSTPTEVAPSFGSEKKRKKRVSPLRNSAHRVKRMLTSPPTSQSASLPSLDSPTMPSSEPYVTVRQEMTLEGGLNSASAALPVDKFPAVGFGSGRRMNNSGNGAFLARMGDD